MNYLPEKTIKYKTYVKTAIVEGLRPVFSQHVDSKLHSTNIVIDYPKTRQTFPAVVVRFYENEIFNAGVGHEETITGDDDRLYKLGHYFYKGNIELAIYTLSALDRDLISDTIVQTLAMGKLEPYTNNFFERIYPDNATEFPDSVGHFININSDRVEGIGEAAVAVPWNSEDELQYTVAYRVDVFGEFYSLPSQEAYFPVSKVLTYPYTDGEPLPLGIDNSNVGWG